MPCVLRCRFAVLGIYRLRASGVLECNFSSTVTANVAANAEWTGARAQRPLWRAFGTSGATTNNMTEPFDAPSDAYTLCSPVRVDR